MRPASADDYKLVLGLMNESADKLLRKLPIDSSSRQKLQEAIVNYIIRVDSSKRKVTREQLVNEYNKVINNIDNAIDSTLKGNDVDFDIFVKTINPKYVPIAKKGTVTPIVKSIVEPTPVKPKVVKTVKPKVVETEKFDIKNLPKEDIELAKKFYDVPDIDDITLSTMMDMDFEDNGFKRVNYKQKIKDKQLNRNFINMDWEDDISADELKFNKKTNTTKFDYEGYDPSDIDNLDNN